MVHPIDLILFKHLFDTGIEGLRRGEIGAERLFDNDSAELAAALVDQTGGAELTDNGAEHRRGDRQIKHDVALRPVLGLDLFEMAAEALIDFGVVQVAADKADAVGKKAPSLFIERDWHAAHLPSRHEAAHFLTEIIAE